MKKIFFGILLLSYINTIAQEEHLVPIDNYLMKKQNRYESILYNFLFVDITDSTLAKIAVIPSFKHEYSMTIRKTGKNEFFLNTIELLNSFKPEYPKLETREIKIGSELAMKMNQLFIKIISQTRFTNKRNVGVDGADYYFIASDCGDCGYGKLIGEGYGVIAGKIWSPDSKRFKEVITLCDNLFSLKSKQEYNENEKKFIEKCIELISEF